MFVECVDNPWVLELLQKMFGKNKKSKKKKKRKNSNNNREKRKIK